MASKKISALIVLGLSMVVYSAPQFQSNSQFQSHQQSSFQSFKQPKSQLQYNQPQYNQPQVQAVAQPQQQSKFVVTQERFHQDPNLEYNFEQKFANGEEFKEDGKLKNVNGMDVIVTRGSYTLVNKDGSTVLVNYYADETGFHPEVVTSAPAPSFDVRNA